MTFKERIKKLFLLLSAVENLQNLLFLRIKDPNLECGETFAVAVCDSSSNTIESKLYYLY